MKQQPIILSVQQITSLLKQQIEAPFQRVWVQGEIANLKTAASGHIYFSLVDPDTLLNAVLFRKEAATLPVLPKNGDSIIAEGQIVLFAARGSYQLIVRSIQHSGLGALLLAKELLKKKLAALGWFKEERKKPLPASIKTIGVITSPTGAVIRDIVHVLTRRTSAFHLLLNPVPVQGEEAPKRIAQAISDMNQYQLADLLIVCRGGGSSEDLAAFDSEIVAKAAFDSSIPIISAVGHETDFTILDLVADIRAPTPSAAAEIASKETKDLLEKISLIKRSLVRGLAAKVAFQKTHLSTIKRELSSLHPSKNIAEQKVFLSQKEDLLLQAITNLVEEKKRALLLAKNLSRSLAPKERLDQRKKTLISTWHTIHMHMKRRLLDTRSTLKKEKESVFSKILWQFNSQKERLKAPSIRMELQSKLARTYQAYRSDLKKLSSHLFSMNPLFPLRKGFALIKNKNDKVYSSIQDLKIDEKVSLIFADGSAEAVITAKQEQTL